MKESSIEYTSNVDMGHLRTPYDVKKEYIVKEISAAPDEGQYVFVSLTDPRDMKPVAQPGFSPTVMGFSSMDDLMKNLQKTLAGLPRQMMGGMATIVKMDMREYGESGLKVGDRVYLEITKIDDKGI